MVKQNSQYQLRPARASDQSLIRRLVLGAGLNPLHLNWEHFILAQSPHGEVVGCGQVKEHSDGARELASIFVVSEQRGRGIASMIITRLLSEQKPPVWLTCRRELTGFYHRFGFREITPAEPMPAYFRWVSRLVRLLALRRRENPLAVMCHGCG